MPLRLLIRPRFRWGNLQRSADPIVGCAVRHPTRHLRHLVISGSTSLTHWKIVCGAQLLICIFPRYTLVDPCNVSMLGAYVCPVASFLTLSYGAAAEHFPAFPVCFCHGRVYAQRVA